MTFTQLTQTNTFLPFCWTMLCVCLCILVFLSQSKQGGGEEKEREKEVLKVDDVKLIISKCLLKQMYIFIICCRFQCGFRSFYNYIEDNLGGNYKINLFHES